MGISGGHGAAPGPPGARREGGWCEAGDAGRGLAAHATSQGASGDVQLGASQRRCICVTRLKAFSFPEFAH